MGSRGETTKGQVDTHAKGARGGSSHAPAPTRRTLTFPRSEVLRRPASRVDASSLFTKEEAPATLLRALGGYESSSELDEPDAEVPPSRPSERSTVPTIASKGIVSDSSARMIELSASELESAREVSALAAPPLPRIRLVPQDAPTAAKAISEPPPRLASSRPPWQRKTLALVVSHGVLGLGVALVVGSGAFRPGRPIAREPNVVLSERTPLASPASATTPLPPSGACAASGVARVLASRAQLGPGLDVSVLETGFGVAL
ncbi:MAG: hypothetical protein K0S65_2422, partial [Labilithrix sp.]|nr:hypothetical protein [Labilithrix sp.]